MSGSDELETIINSYSESNHFSEASASETESNRKTSMVSRLQASMMDEEELFPEKFADPYVFTESESEEIAAGSSDEDISTIVSSDNEKQFNVDARYTSTGIVEADIELVPTPEQLLAISTEIQDKLDFDESSTEHLEDQQLLDDIHSIPDRLAFKIGDVADIVDVKQYVLRYWETEFEVLKPKKSRQNQRMYTKKDIENVLLIKKLLYRDKFSIEGARRALKALKAQVKETKQWDQVVDRYDHAIDQIRLLVEDIRGVKSLFETKSL